MNARIPRRRGAFRWALLIIVMAIVWRATNPAESRPRPTAVEPTAVEPTAVEPTAVEPTAVRPTAAGPAFATVERPAPEVRLLRPARAVGADGRWELTALVRNTSDLVAPDGIEVVASVYAQVKTTTQFSRRSTPEGLAARSVLGQASTLLPSAPATAPDIPVTVVMQVGNPCLSVVVPCIIVSEPGVYPVLVELRRRGVGLVFDRFVTYLVYAPLVETRRLGVALLFPFHRPAGQRPAGSLTTLASPLSILVDALGARPSVPVTVLPTPETVDGLDQGGAGGDPDLVGRLRAVLAGREVLSGPYVNIDDTHLHDRQLITEMRAAERDGRLTLDGHLGVPVRSGVYVVPENASVPSREALAAFRVTALITSDDALMPTTFKAPRDRPVTFDSGADDNAAVAGIPLIVLDPSIDRRLRTVSRPDDAALAIGAVLAELALLRFTTETPGAVVIRLPAQVITTASIDGLLEGLTNNALLQPITVSEAFRRPIVESPRGEAASRIARSRPATPDPLAPAIENVRRRVDGYASLFAQRPTSAGLFRRALVASLAVGPSDHGASKIDALRRRVDAELDKVQVLPGKSFRLTSRSGKIPLTFTNSLGETAFVRVVLRGDKLVFKDAPTEPVPLANGSTQRRFEVQSRSPGSSVLSVTLRTPVNNIQLSGSAYRVRSTAASWVGLALTGGAILILAIWWGGNALRVRRQRALHRHPTATMDAP